MILAKQSTAVTVSFGPAVLNSDGVTFVTNLTGTGSNQTENTSTGIRISKNGAALAARHATAGASNYDAFGHYLVPLDTTDTNTCGVLRMTYGNAAAFCPLFMDIMILPANAYDSLVGGTDALDVSVIQLLGTAWLTPGTAGTPDVNVKLWNGLTTVALPLIPTTAGRTLDVSAGGEAGIDWGNIGSKTTTNDLSGTTIPQVTNVTNVNNPVTAGTVTDKTGYSLTQSFPTNFAAQVISAAGIASADVKKINAVTIVGDGSGTPFNV